MKAIQILKPGELAMIDVPQAPLQPGYARIKIRAVGVCAGDITAYKGYNVTIRYPRILGHEAVGEILEISGGAGQFRVGDRVALEPFLPCGTCRTCRMGVFNNCRNLHVLGVHIDGAMTEEMVHPISHLVPIPNDLDWELAVLAEPMAIGVHALRRAHIEKGQQVVISGAGPIGLLCAIVCRDMQAHPIILDPLAEKRQTARRIGFTDVLDAAAPDCAAQIAKVTGENGVDAVIECSGSQAGLNSALDYAAHSGYVIVVGWPKGTVDLDLAKCIVKELHLDGSRNSYGEFPRAMEVIQRNKETARQLISNIHSFEKLPDAMVDFAGHPEKYMKLMTTM